MEKAKPKNKQLQIFIFSCCVLLCLLPGLSPAIGLILGIIAANLLAPNLLPHRSIISKYLLHAAVIGLGFGLNIQQAISISKQGFWFTICTIACAIGLGLLLGLITKTEKITAYLISCATAICGGSAVAAVAPVVRANEKQISIALAAVFILNALALFLFPVIGEALHMSQQSFGLWCAIAIHDTSSVVGAASHYGEEAVMVATTVKLTRALFIIPLTLASTLLFKNRTGKTKMPWFIVLFILASVAGTYVPPLAQLSPFIISLAKTAFTLTLFLIGLGMSRSSLLNVGYRPFLMALLLWVALAVTSLALILKA